MDRRVMNIQNGVSVFVGSFAGVLLGLASEKLMPDGLHPLVYYVLAILTALGVLAFTVGSFLRGGSGAIRASVLSVVLIVAAFFWIFFCIVTNPFADLPRQPAPGPSANAQPVITVVVTPYIIVATPTAEGAAAQPGQPAAQKMPPPSTVESRPPGAAVQSMLTHNLSSLARITGTRPAKNAIDNCTPPKTTTFAYSNVADQQESTAWRVVGDGAGAYLLFEFPGVVTIERVSFIPGYNKLDPCLTNVDWCKRNRIPREVLVELSSGKAVRAVLPQQCAWADIPFAGDEARWVRLTIVDSYERQEHHYADYTAISEVAIIGQER